MGKPMLSKAFIGEPAHTARLSYIFLQKRNRLGHTIEIPLKNPAIDRPVIFMNKAITNIKMFFNVSQAIMGASFYNQKPLLPKYSHTHFYYV